MGERQQTRVPTCRSDGAPLVATFAFPKAEFVCLDCGALFGWFGPTAADETPELLARTEAYRREWAENAGSKILTPRARHRDCVLCDGGEDHVDHATEDEIAADSDARAWLKRRAYLSGNVDG
jgi:hypothetical protein